VQIEREKKKRRGKGKKRKEEEEGGNCSTMGRPRMIYVVYISTQEKKETKRFEDESPTRR